MARTSGEAPRYLSSRALPPCLAESCFFQTRLPKKAIFFFFNDTPPPDLSPLSPPHPLPISHFPRGRGRARPPPPPPQVGPRGPRRGPSAGGRGRGGRQMPPPPPPGPRVSWPAATSAAR